MSTSSNDRDVIYLKDYQEPDYLIETTDLEFFLSDDATLVKSRLHIKRNTSDHSQRLILDGQDIELLTVKLDGSVLDETAYEQDENHLTIHSVPDQFDLEINNRIHPESNTSLEGLYKSSGIFCTQCEAEGFRKITYFLDRPDVMSLFTTKITAEKEKYPVLLSNGNPVESGDNEDGTHWVKWEDPFKKPSYLFALVAGDLACNKDQFTTHSGRDIKLEIYVEKENYNKCDHAMASLKNAMRWDEDKYGLEYDLDIYMIVAVNDFNMGAMENKGLNVFNSKYVLANPEAATDSDFEGIEGVIGHEYFHNWTGNRVTCRDWFQLSLKEGLTVFRDQEFSSDMQSRAVKRIQDVRILRGHQFLEDSGPMAHSVRPDSYVEINNFYTSTVYNKGAEVVRMYQEMLGEEGFRKGMDLYFERFDGQAVTTDDFYQCMEDANQVDLGNFRRWYSQAGTPVINVNTDYDAENETYTLSLAQTCNPTPKQESKEPFVIPVQVGLLDSSGHEIPLVPAHDDGQALTGTQSLLLLSESSHEFKFTNVQEKPVLSVLRGFSAPVKINYEYSDEELSHLLAHDTDSFNRWDAGQRLATNIVLSQMQGESDDREIHIFIDALSKLLNDVDADPALAAEILQLPSVNVIAESLEVIDVDAIYNAREKLIKLVAEQLKPLLYAKYNDCMTSDTYQFNAESVGRRKLKNICLWYLMHLEDNEITELCYQQYLNSDNMTDSFSALSTLVDYDVDERNAALKHFYDKWHHDALVLDKWFSVQACSKRKDTLNTVIDLLEHESFDINNPNKVRSLIGAFCSANPIRFHDTSGSGYKFLGTQVNLIDKNNPQIAARLAGSLTRWKRFTPDRQALMKQQLERILAEPDVSPDCYEIASKSLQ